MWRQGDILIAQAPKVPAGATRSKSLVLASGDSTGQRHQLRRRKGIELYRAENEMMFLVIPDGEAIVTHPEHGPITLSAGTYRIWKQREFGGAGLTRRVQD